MCKECKPFNMCLGEAYCEKCGKKEGYNINDPWSMPTKCKNCGGDMTNYEREQFLKDLHTTFSRKIISDTRKKNRSPEDQFFINVLESLRDKFEEGEIYSGKHVRLMIDVMIKRME